ncbi:MAG: hypothetical protein IJ616_08930 [Bacteroidales bacterium]|nr:hypothetical protein [Bacteroidales bacterium]
MLLKQKDSAYSRSVQAVSHSLSKPKWMGRTGKTGVKPDFPAAMSETAQEKVSGFSFLFVYAKIVPYLG